MAAVGGLLSYLSYAFAHGSWANPALIGVSIFVGVFLPSYAKLSNKAELWANNQFGFVTAGRLGRFVPQLAFNLVVFWLMLWGGALNQLGMASVGGVAGAALVTTLASQGTQYLGGYLVARGIGDANRNMLVGLLVNVTVAALGTAGVPGAREAFLFLGFGLGGTLFLVGSAVGPALRRGTQGRHRPLLRHVQSVPQHPPFDHPEARSTSAGSTRSSSIRCWFPSCMSMLSARASSGSVGLKDGFQIYEKTEKADFNVDYFPTGNMFLPPETRVALIELALAEAGLADKVEVAVYSRDLLRQGLPGRDRRDQDGVIPASACTCCTARISAACWCARSATNAAGSIRGASCAATRSRRRPYGAAPRA